MYPSAFISPICPRCEATSRDSAMNRVLAEMARISAGRKSAMTRFWSISERMAIWDGCSACFTVSTIR